MHFWKDDPFGHRDGPCQRFNSIQGYLLLREKPALEPPSVPAVVLHLLWAPERTTGGSHGLTSKAGRALPPSASLLNTWKASGFQRLAFTLHYIKVQFNSRLKETKETWQHHVTPDSGLDVLVISNICWDNLHNMNGVCIGVRCWAESQSEMLIFWFQRLGCGEVGEWPYLYWRHCLGAMG